MMHHNVGNSEGRPISDLKVRQAIDLAIDRTALSQALVGGCAEIKIRAPHAIDAILSP